MLSFHNESGVQFMAAIPLMVLPTVDTVDTTLYTFHLATDKVIHSINELETLSQITIVIHSSDISFFLQF